MKTILKKTVGFTVIISLCLSVIFFVSCEKSEQEPPVSNVSFTPCQQEILKNSNLSGNVDIAFTGKGVEIKQYDFAVACDFTTVNVSHTFVNGVLNITQQGSPNQARCICYTEVSYTISGISQDEVNVIFINGVQVYCYNDNNTLKGEWSWVKTYGGFHGTLIDNEFSSILKIKNQNSIVNYEVYVADTLFYIGFFSFLQTNYSNVSIVLPHWTANENNLWNLSFHNENWAETKDTICFFSGNDDDYMYYYKKIKQ